MAMPAAPGAQMSASARRAPRRFPTILFDLDGTLLDSIQLILESARYAFKKLGRDCPPDSEWLTGVGIPLVTMFGRYARDAADCAALIAAYREYQLPNHDRLISSYGSAPAVVERLHRRGHEIGIVTSKSEALSYRGLARISLARFVDTVVGCDVSSRHKPDPEPVRIALSRLDCRPEDAIFVGDSIHDLLAGNAAGVRSVAALWGAFSRANLEPGEPSAWLTDISELEPLLERWARG
jgi:pyrophosphatase PpaX